MKYLGIDYGTKRIGVALSDDGGTFAFPKTVVGAKEALTEIVALCKQEQVSVIVLGESVASNESLNEVAALAARFKEALEAAIGLPVYLEREDFSSVEAHRYQIDAGARDDSAAAIILQRFLDKQKK